LVKSVLVNLIKTGFQESLVVFWRKFRLDWSYAIGELIIVTVGVLIALAIDEWNSQRLEKSEEFDILSRLITDIESDLQGYEGRLSSIDDKEESLLRLMSALADNGPQNVSQFLNDVVVGANYGWNQGRTQRSTFSDLLGSGSLRIIADAEIRVLIAEYYDQYDGEHTRIDERETEFPHISYQIVPRSPTTVRFSSVSELRYDADLSDEFLNERLKVAQEPSFMNHVIAELNLARFIRGITFDLQDRAVVLRNRLEEYQEEIK
jgi:hypothetical protein